jgi:GTP-binding protein HflX
VGRNGRVEYVMVGDAFSITLPDFKRVRTGAGRFRGLRCIHTHLRGEPLTRDDLTDLALLRLDAMVAVLVSDSGLPDKVDYAPLQPPDGSGETVTRHPPLAASQLDFDFAEWIEELEARFGEAQKGIAVEGAGERAVLGLHGDRQRPARRRALRRDEGASRARRDCRSSTCCASAGRSRTRAT